MPLPAPVDFSSLVFFGDSLTDNGNLFALIGQPAPPYFNGRFSNGPTYAELVPGLLGVGAANFAFGGAEAVTGNGNPGEFAPINLTAQVDYFLASLAGNPPPAGTAAALFIGNNDYLRAASTPQTPPDLIAGVLGNVDAAVQRLLGAGVDKIILFTLPGIDLAPAGAALGPAGVAAYDAIVSANNAGLAALAAGYAGAGVDVEVVDIYRFFTEMKNDTETFGFKVTTIPEIVGGVPTGITALFDSDEIAFFDELHPTATLHGVTAGYVAAVLGSDSVRISDAGNDHVHAGRGNDFVMTGTGDDYIFGGRGSDLILAGTGRDFADGGAGSDVIAGGGGNDRLFGGGDSDVVAGGTGNDVAEGGAGADLVVLGTGSDWGFGGSGNDWFIVEDEPGSADRDLVFGGSGRDVLQLWVSQATWANAAFQADVQHFAASFRNGGFRDHSLETVGLYVNGIERLEVYVDVRGATGEAASLVAGAAAPVIDPGLAAAMARADLWGFV
jgi:phospholipase/lecithinase/hemolysin